MFSYIACLLFFVKQKTAYEVRISDWSSDVCSSDLTGAPTPAVSADDLSWAVVAMRAGERIVVNAALIAAYQAASSPHSIRALRSDLEAFDLWCRRHNRIALPASPETVADYLEIGRAHV